MSGNELVLGKNRRYSLDCYKTKVNNNVLVVGASGAGKTRGIVIPNLLQASGSYVVSDPKGNLYGKYKDYLEAKGYDVKKLDFTNPAESVHYNFFNYIRSTQDIVKVAHMITGQEKITIDPFWDLSAQLLVQALIAYQVESLKPEERNLKTLMKLVSLCMVDENMSSSVSKMDLLMEVR